LDAGSGPVQYPEYLEYHRGYQYRVCADISITALREARKRLGDRGMYVVADIANLPFKSQAFEGVVSLHTVHHLPEDEHLRAFKELHRVLSADCSAVVVNSWPDSQLVNVFEPLVKLSIRIRYLLYRLQCRLSPGDKPISPHHYRRNGSIGDSESGAPKGTFTSRHDVNWIKEDVGALMPLEIRVWRSVSVRFLRALIHRGLGGRYWLRLLYWFEERYPHFFGERGKYPLIIIQKNPGGTTD
jgi:SAM-dependent methyltransferase